MAFSYSPRGVYASPSFACHRSASTRVLSVLVVQSELAGETAQAASHAAPAPSSRSSAVPSPPPSPSLRRVAFVAADAAAEAFVDVDAVDGTAPITTTTSAAAVAPSPSPPLPLPHRARRPIGHAALRDAVVLSYRRPSDDYVSDYRSCAGPAATPPVDELLAVAIEEGRVFLRRSGLSTRRVDSGGADSAVPVHAWRQRARAVEDEDDEVASETAAEFPTTPSMDEDEEAVAAEDASGRRGRGKPFLRWRSGAAASAASSRVPARQYAAQWRQEGGVLLEHAGGTLHRIRPRGGALGATVHTSSTHSHCKADFVALSTNTLTLVQAREYGADLDAVQHTAFACGMSANAICVDDWGPHASVVGFSDGTLRVVDWRVPPQRARSDETRSDDDEDEDGGSVVLRTRVPQPTWLRASRGRRSRSGAPASVAGVLSCCALHDGVRVVCGLGDASGAVVMTDLRRPDDDAGGRVAGRRRKRAEAEAAQRLFPAVGGQSPTGRAVSDIRADPAVFGRLGLVDVSGDTVVTSVAALERAATDSTAPAVARVTTATTRPSTTAAAPQRPRLPPPPSPWSVLERLGSFSPATSRYAVLASILPRLRAGRAAGEQGEWFRGPVALQPRPRCTFSEDGEVLASTAARGTATGTLRPTPHRVVDANGGCRATYVQVGATAAADRWRQGAAEWAPAPFVAVSCVDGLVSFDADDGQTLAVDVLR